MKSQRVGMMLKRTLLSRSEMSLPKPNAGSSAQQSNSFHDTLGEESGTQTALRCAYGLCVCVSVDVRFGSLPTLELR